LKFNVNSPILFILGGIVIAAVLAQSVFFLVKAWKRGREIGMSADKLKQIAVTAAIFTIAANITAKRIIFTGLLFLCLLVLIICIVQEIPVCSSFPQKTNLFPLPLNYIIFMLISPQSIIF
jgi:uncharacterized membrane protein YcjF (UPF0283 family)